MLLLLRRLRRLLWRWRRAYGEGVVDLSGRAGEKECEERRLSWWR